MATPNKAGILNSFNALPEGIKGYFSHFPALVEEFPWHIPLGYLFSQIETAQNMVIYGAVVKLHKVNSAVARSTVDKHHMTRARFRELYKLVVGKEIATGTIAKAKEAETIRDKILHGKTVSEADKRKAVAAALEYSNLLNEQVFEDVGFRPFGSMQGFKGRAKALDKSTSRWVLTGMGLIGKK